MAVLDGNYLPSKSRSNPQFLIEGDQVVKNVVKNHRNLSIAFGVGFVVLVFAASLGMALNPLPPKVNDGVALMEEGRLDEAIAKFDEAIRADPICAEAYANRAKAYILLGKDAESRRDVETAIAQGFDRSVLEEEIESLRQQFSAR